MTETEKLLARAVEAETSARYLYEALKYIRSITGNSAHSVAKSACYAHEEGLKLKEQKGKYE